MEHDGYRIFSFTNPHEPWFVTVRKMLKAFPEVPDGTTVAPDGSVEYPSIYYHPTMQLIVMNMALGVRQCIADICGYDKWLSYVPGKFVYYSYPHPVFSDNYRWERTTFFRKNEELAIGGSAARTFVAYFNMDTVDPLHIHVRAGSHLGAAEGLPSKMLKTTQPLVDDKGKLYETLTVPPNRVLLLDGRLVEYVDWRVPRSSSGAWMSCVFVVSESPDPLFGGANVRSLSEQGQPIVWHGSSHTDKRCRVSRNGKAWLQASANSKMKEASEAKGIWLGDNSLRMASLEDAGLQKWPIAAGFSSLIHGVRLDRMVSGKKRARDRGSK